MEWTQEARYRTYESMTAEERLKLERCVSASPWRQKYHIQPMYGLLNDPNGFVWFKGRYHLFYQWFPFGAVHGMKHWFHTESANLVEWENKGVALQPELSFESHGIYSGSGFVHKNSLYLFYTGNKRDEEWNRHSSKCLAIMNRNGKITKRDVPIIKRQPNGYTEHFRDPKVWQVEDKFYMVVGAQRENVTGCVLLYQSYDLIAWSLLGEIATKETDFGYMWECPDYFPLQNYGILLCSPQGLKPEGDSYRNIYHSGVWVGKPLNIENGHFDHGDFQELDAGFDFYAPQTTLSPDGRRLLVGWMGLPEIEYPTDSEGWAHCLTIPRELSIKEGLLCQQPVRELKEKRKKEARAAMNVSNEVSDLGELSGDCFEMIGEIEVGNAKRAGLRLRVGKGEETILYLNTETQKVVLDRTNAGLSFAQDYGSIRQKHYSKNKIRFHIFMDTSSIEVFVNDGEMVFTSRLFPRKESQGIQFFAEKGTAKIDAVQWKYD
ncbi:sucrose-6-phosphate hydrolase [Peribacillus simplex]|uniref:Sucrose-6-phosphate hydrolase n=1 Tax=Peribacillus simplex TaxID=1478 RepID=A0A109N0J9_9BACI|nr:sucrose-6-phosphate hydrolase [Peribacillus simplex]KWW21266.1 sucrose-6-phosphate hydrolase [Peribacillus simplex]